MATNHSGWFVKGTVVETLSTSAWVSLPSISELRRCTRGIVVSRNHAALDFVFALELP